MNYCKDEDSEKPNQAIPNVEEPLTTIDREILHFIRGSISCTFFKTKMSQIKQNKQDKHRWRRSTLSSHLVSHRNHLHARHSHSCLTEGGLKYIKHSVVGLLELLEVNFRSKFSSGQLCSSGQFVKDCLDDRVLVTGFCYICYGVQADEENKESVLEGILKLFFKIRIHNRCKVFFYFYG